MARLARQHAQASEALRRTREFLSDAEKPATPIVHNPEITTEFADLVLRMLAKKREERLKDFHEFMAKFRGLRLLFKSSAVRKKSN